jgi:hypothetical protein
MNVDKKGLFVINLQHILYSMLVKSDDLVIGNYFDIIIIWSHE